MSTTPVTVTQTWSSIATGPTTISISPQDGSPPVLLAVSADIPDFNAGHPVSTVFITYVELKESEILYALCKKGNGFLVVTD